MKNRRLKISIFMLLLSICACGLFSWNNSITAHAASDDSVDCYYLLADDGAYLSNTVVGSVSGNGEFVLGNEDVELSASANANYRLVGWQVTYNEQDDRKEFFGVEDLTDGAKTVVLKAKDKTDDSVDNPEEIEATITYNIHSSGYFTSGTFALQKVFEDLTINPVFDHIYFRVNINELVDISSHEESVDFDGNSLFYETMSENDGVVTYSNAYLKSGDNYYYYGDVCFGGGEYYTLHKTLEETPRTQKANYSHGAFRVNDIVDIAFDVDIDSNDIKLSKNIDFKNVSVVSNKTNKLDEYEVSLPYDYYIIEKDQYLRTKNYTINFMVLDSANYLNTIDLTYHDLYVVNVNLLVDGSKEHNEHSDILGKLTVSASEIISNLSIYNFYSTIDVDNLSFLVKTSADNNSRSFGLNALETITTATQTGVYRYYTLSNIDGQNKSNIYYTNINQNLEINVDYTSVKYTISFGIAEYMIDGNMNPVLVEMDVEAPASISLKRGSSLFSGTTTPAQDLGEVDDFYLNVSTMEMFVKDASGWVEHGQNEDIAVLGYKFIGYASSLTSSVEVTYSYQVDSIEPQGTSVWLCLKKEEYSIGIENYNQVVIGSNKALTSVTITKLNAAGQTSEMLTSIGTNPTLVGNSVTLTNIKASLGERILITYEVNNGFNVQYSLLSPVQIQDMLDEGKTEEELSQYYITVFDITESIIENYISGSKLTIYVYEEKIEYSLTYCVDVNTDDGQYVMAEIDVADYEDEQNNENFQIVKFDLNGVEISAANSNLDAAVSKIVISGLYLNDTVTLKSLGNPYNEDYYVFNWFIDGRSTLSFVKDGSNYNHTESVVKTRTIQVVYSVPVAQVLISLEQDFEDNEAFTYSIVVKVDDAEVSPIAGQTNVFSIGVGKVTSITVGGLSYGYNFVGYQVNDKPLERVNGNTFEHTTVLGSNTIILKFERTLFQFYFAQYDAVVSDQELNGDYVKFDGIDYAELTVDNTNVDITKPLGYYVESVKIGEDLLSVEVENNLEHRLFADVPIYKFKLSREEFIGIVTTYGVDNIVDGVLEVYINLYYEVYKYDIEIKHTNSSGETHATDVQYLPVSLTYSHNGETVTVPYPYASDVVNFEEVVPYGAVAEVNVLGQLQLGLRFVGWAHPDTTLVRFENSAQYLKLGQVIGSKNFLYMFTYDTHKIKLDYVSLQGNPQIEVNNNLTDVSNTTINLFDSLKITANAIRTNGYKFKAISYNKVIYNEYIYNKDTWSEEYSNLYVLSGHAYIQNTEPVYDENKDYFTREILTEICDESNELLIDKFIINEFVVVDKTITFNIEYELLQLLITNTTQETEDGTIAGEIVKKIIDFNIDDIVVLTIVATNKENETRDISATDTVTFNDVVQIRILINKEALESNSNKTYDLSLGVELSSVQISGKIVDFTAGEVGEYFVGFNVSEFLPEVGEEINIIYSVKVQQKNIMVTTVVTESTEFYENVYLFANSQMPFGETVNSNKKSFLNKDWQFLAPLDHIYTVMSDDYAKLFKTSGVKIYLTEYDAATGKYIIVGNAIDPAEYANYGISIILNERNVDKVGKVEDHQVSIDNLMHNFQVVFQVQPIIIYNEGPRFQKVFLCESDGTGIAQKLTYGSEDECDIQLADEIKNVLEIKYQLLVGGVISGSLLDEVTNVGEYKVVMTFNGSGAYDWFEDVLLAENISLTIKPRDLMLTYSANTVASNRVDKIYNKSSAYNVENVFRFLVITDGEEIEIPYGSLLSVGSSNLKLDPAIDCYISSDGKDAAISRANEKIYYNLYVYNIAFQDSEFNRNFNLLTKDLIIQEYIKIKKLAIDLTGVSVYDKVYDGTSSAELSSAQDISVSKKMPGDDLIVDTEKMIIKFEDYSVGTNKSVIIDTSRALAGYDAGNYTVNNIRIRGLTIYPYSLSVNVGGVGKVTLYNERGLTDKQYIDLIPLNATLSVKAIRPDSADYANIHGKISSYVKGNNEYAMGYSLSMLVNGSNKDISNKLFISLPRVKNMTGVYFLSGSDSGAINYKIVENNVVIDLKDVKSQVQTIFLTQKKILLKPWQIALIVITSVALVAAGVLAFVIIRKRKHKSYSVHDKI